MIVDHADLFVTNCRSQSSALKVAAPGDDSVLEVKDDLVYDVGANNGDDTAFYLLKGYRVLAIEADPSLMEELNARFAKEIASGQLKILNVALAPTRSVMPFWICEGYSLWNSFDREVASREGRPVRCVDVEAWPLQEIFQKYGVPHYLKLSLHGEEDFCLADIHAKVGPTYISLELPRSAERAEQVFARLAALGYRQCKVIDQTNHKQFAVSPSVSTSERLRQLIKRHKWLHAAARGAKRALGANAPEQPRGGSKSEEWVFPEGSSGPFGDETDGEWRDTAAMQTEYRAYMDSRTQQEGSDLSIWHDLHVVRPR